jgi:hypothetical protein
LATKANLISVNARWFEPKRNECLARVAPPALAEAEQALDRVEVNAIAVRKI